MLARKAATQRWQPSVAHWLHKTAHQLALKARTAELRRACREGKTESRSPANPLAEITGQELLAALDEELLALPERLRAPLVLCYLQGATRDEAALQLGCPLSTLRKRLERGRERLHDAMLKRGLGLSTVLLGTLVTRRSADAAAASLLARKTAKVALAFAGGGTVNEVVSPQVNHLIQGQFTTMFSKTVRFVLALLVVGGFFRRPVRWLIRPGMTSKFPRRTQTSPAVPAKTVEPPVAARKMRVKVFDPRGKPLEGARSRPASGPTKRASRPTATT